MEPLLNRPEMWQHLISDEKKTVETNADIFRLWAGLESGVQRFMGEPNRAMPTNLWVVDEAPSEASKIMGCVIVKYKPYFSIVSLSVRTSCDYLLGRRSKQAMLKLLDLCLC